MNHNDRLIAMVMMMVMMMMMGVGLELISPENMNGYFKEAMRILNESVMMFVSNPNSTYTLVAI
jgi:hypothetical protein